MNYTWVMNPLLAHVRIHTHTHTMHDTIKPLAGTVTDTPWLSILSPPSPVHCSSHCPAQCWPPAQSCGLRYGCLLPLPMLAWMQEKRSVLTKAILHTRSPYAVWWGGSSKGKVMAGHWSATAALTDLQTRPLLQTSGGHTRIPIISKNGFTVYDWFLIIRSLLYVL